MEKEKKIKRNSTHKAIERYFKLAVIAFFAGIIGWKLLTTTWTIDMSKFDFTALLSLLLALFSVGLSVFFYFKATDTSNQFYDNTYKFTRDISEILGRIEAGFGERLKHLDEGYSGLRDKFHNGHISPFIADKIERTAKEIEEEKKKLEQQMKEKEEILEKLMSRAKIQETEKSKILQSINSKDKHIHELSDELQFLKRKLQKEEILGDREILNRYPNRIIEMMSNIVTDKLGTELVLEAPFIFVSRKFKTRISDSLSERAKMDFRKFEITDEKNELTEKGYHLMRNIAKRLV